jgi:adenylate cyclase
LMRNLLNLYVSPEVARNALENGTELGGQLVTCSVLFADIRDFTTISERLDPEALMKLLNQYMSQMVEVIVAHGGMVNKFGGDSLLAVFGTPLNPQADHASQAVRAARAMFVALDRFNGYQAQWGQPQLRIGVGVATGAVVAGNVGGQERLEYTVIGDTVNLAARLQDKTKEMPANLLISEATYEALGDEWRVRAEQLTAVAVKGKQRPISVYIIRD